MHRWLPAVLILASCAPRTVPVPTITSELAEPVLDLTPPAHSPDTVVQMHAWLQSAETARTYLTQGDLESARQAAACMAASPSPNGIPDGWRPFAADLLAEASAMAASEDAAPAGAHLGKMAMACGTCHTEAGVLAQVSLQVLPEEIFDTNARMEHHQWGSDWMWFGLVTANEQAYRLGAASFTSGRLPLPPNAVSGTELTPLLDEVTAIAAQAAAAEDDVERARHYGELLTSCAACHVQLADE